MIAHKLTVFCQTKGLQQGKKHISPRNITTSSYPFWHTLSCITVQYQLLSLPLGRNNRSALCSYYIMLQVMYFLSIISTGRREFGWWYYHIIPVVICLCTKISESVPIPFLFFCLFTCASARVFLCTHTLLAA